MAKTIRDDLNRPSGRFVRSLALSVGGGALLTFLGAGVAGAQDGGNAGTASDGAGAANSGDAVAVGNRSGTTKTQTGSASGTVGSLQVTGQTAAVANVGVAVANTGGNVATGNNSNNTTTATQTAINALGPATNTGTAANSSNGTATISTGDATAVGNESKTVVDQNSSTSGQLGNILVVQQSGLVVNAGVAVADTGNNVATGNTSVNEAGLLQEAAAAAGLAGNTGTARNTSDGLATVWTGNASATGNLSDSKVTQAANGSAGGDPGGFALIPQGALVVNAGVAQATTGGNVATGNESDNINPLGLDQTVGDIAGPDGPIGVASNQGEASNFSNGQAHINTGDARAVGNESSTGLGQNHDASIGPDAGISVAPQVAAVVNVGAATANTGGNFATGNTSDNQVGVTQDIPPSGGTDIGVASNFGQASTDSDGGAWVTTGDASATGSKASTAVEQEVLSNGGFLNLQTQAGLVVNAGVATANTGGNFATGNASDNDAFVEQDAVLSDDPGIDLGVVGQFGKASATSGGSATIDTGAASATGNDSGTTLDQTIDPSGLVINTQVGGVLNVGAASANSGGNTAIGNESFSNTNLVQGIEIGEGNAAGGAIVAGTIVAANNGEAAAASDGSANIRTGAASAKGNASETHVSQNANGAIDGNGFVLNTQVAPVLNAGFAAADSGDNLAIGNTSTNNADLEQDVFIASDNGGDADLLAGIVTASNDGTASNASDGTANITTGAATATGNRSQSVLEQSANGEIDGLGAVINTQLPLIANVGVGVANSGNNQAVGNVSVNDQGGADLDQAVEIASDNGGAADLTAAFVTGANSGSAENASDGTADISTGAAQATGNASSTRQLQGANGHAPGLVLNTQVGGVVNAGVGVANSGGNFAFGNGSTNEAEAEQDADILSENVGDADLLAIGALTAANQGTASSTSDGTAVIKTGDAQAQGNVSSTFLDQQTDSTVAGLGATISTQVGGVANVGVGVANSGLNLSIGNASTNDSELEQDAEIGSDNDLGDPDFTVIGPVTASNSGEATNSSDGRSKVKTGGALATGNASATNLSQIQDDDVNLVGLVAGTQIGGVANVGVGVANSGLNLAIGNVSENDIDDVGGGPAADQDADILSDGDPNNTILVGPVTAANQLEASNTSDGEACVCTGDAVASGNVSSTTLIQSLDLSANAGVVILTEAGGVLNAGLGLANTGLNGAIGNSSDNTVQFDQDADINTALLTPVDGPQTAHSGGTAANSSAGTALVASGNASGTGNQSTTDFVQAATADGGFAFSTLAGGTTNAGAGIANAGLNFGLGNDSTNLAVLDQSADGSGIVSNQGEATNDSDGTAIIGNPEECEDEAAPPAEQPGNPGGLPRTGAELEVQAAVGLMLLLLGFGLQRRSRRMA